MDNCKVIAITNQKGGVGKTTTTVNLGVGLARQGRRVLLLDADPQGSLSISLGIKQPDDLSVSLATIMQGVIEDEPVPIDTAVHHHAEGVDFIPANIELSGIDVSLVNTMSREHVLKTHVNDLRKYYDYIMRCGRLDPQIAVCIFKHGSLVQGYSLFQKFHLMRDCRSLLCLLSQQVKLMQVSHDVQIRIDPISVFGMNN